MLKASTGKRLSRRPRFAEIDGAGPGGGVGMVCSGGVVPPGMSRGMLIVTETSVLARLGKAGSPAAVDVSSAAAGPAPRRRQTAIWAASGGTIGQPRQDHPKPLSTNYGLVQGDLPEPAERALGSRRPGCRLTDVTCITLWAAAYRSPSSRKLRSSAEA